MLNSNSIERLVPEHVVVGEATGEETLALHLARYEFAAKHIRGGAILDSACGVGYGSSLLAAAGADSSTVVGVDIDADAIAYAQRVYAAPNITFVVSDLLHFRPEGLFDSVVSLETIEHVEDPRAVVGHLVSLLRPGGIFVGSVPVTPSVDANPHHRTDFTGRTFRALGSAVGLTEVASLEQRQRFSPLAIARRTEARTQSLRKNLGRYYLQNPVSLMRRIYATARFGFENRYLTIVWKRHSK